VKKRIIVFVLRILFAIAGAIPIYFEFLGKGDQSYMDTSYFSYGTLFLGIGLLMVAFEKKMKPTEKDTGSNPK